MAPTDQETEVVPPAEEPEELPLPSDPKAIFLGGLFILALLATAYVASEIVLPLVFAIILKLLLQPAVRILERLHVPRILAALLLIIALFGTIVGLGTAISGPAGTWAAKLPEGIPRLQERLSFMREPINTLQQFLQRVEDFGAEAPSPTAAPAARGPTLLTKLFTGTRNFAGGFFTTVLFLFFLLVSGDVFLQRLVEIMPRFSGKRQVVEISQQIESDISAYLVTITIMNAAVGVAMGLAMWLTGVGDPILWGTVAFLLNYVPILGTALGVLIFLLAGLLTIDTLWLLIAEDDLLIVDMTEEVLIDHGYEVCGIARTVGEGVALGRLHKPDLALLDMRLADGGLGTEIAAQLSRFGRLGVLFATGNALHVMQNSSEGDACIVKPYSSTDLVRALEIVADIVATGTASPPFPRGFALLPRATITRRAS